MHPLTRPERLSIKSALEKLSGAEQLALAPGLAWRFESAMGRLYPNLEHLSAQNAVNELSAHLAAGGKLSSQMVGQALSAPDTVFGLAMITALVEGGADATTEATVVSRERLRGWALSAVSGDHRSDFSRAVARRARGALHALGRGHVSSGGEEEAARLTPFPTSAAEEKFLQAVASELPTGYGELGANLARIATVRLRGQRTA